MMTSQYTRISATERRARTDELVHRLSQLDQDDHGPGERERIVEELILVNLCVARSIAHGYRGRGVELDDLEQVASAALVRATKNYQPEDGSDYLAYIVPSVKGEVKRYFRDRAWSVRPPRRLQDLRLKALDERDRQSEGSDRRADYSAIAQALGADAHDVEAAMGLTSHFRAGSLDAPLDNGETTFADVLADPRGDQDHRELEAQMVVAPLLASLTQREQLLLRLRYWEGLSQADIAGRLGITQTHVSRLQRRILDRMRTDLTADDAVAQVLPLTQPAGQPVDPPAAAAHLAAAG